MTYAAVIFDCDGVLIDSEPIANAILAADLTEIGLPMTPEESHRRFTGCATTQIAEMVRAEIGVAPPPDWVSIHNQRVRDAVAAGVEAIPGVVDVLDALDSAGIPWGVASQSGPLYLELALGRVGIWQRASGRVVSAQSVARPKPAPDVYLEALSRIGAHPGSALIVEDSPTGVRAGVAAGARVVGFAAAQDPATLIAAGASHTVPSMADLGRWIGAAPPVGATAR